MVSVLSFQFLHGVHIHSSAFNTGILIQHIGTWYKNLDSGFTVLAWLGLHSLQLELSLHSQSSAFTASARSSQLGLGVQYWYSVFSVCVDFMAGIWYKLLGISFHSASSVFSVSSFLQLGFSV